MLADTDLRTLLAAFASPTSTPAGGSAAALSSAVGCSLLMMAAALGPPAAGSDHDRSTLAAALRNLQPLQRELTDAIDRDALAYAHVFEALRLRRSADRDQADLAMQQALREATDAPLAVLRHSAQALGQAALIAPRCRRSVSSDLRVGIELLVAGCAGAQSSVEANLHQVTDDGYADRARTDMARWASEAAAAADASRRAL